MLGTSQCGWKCTGTYWNDMTHELSPSNPSNFSERICFFSASQWTGFRTKIFTAKPSSCFLPNIWLAKHLAIHLGCTCYDDLWQRFLGAKNGCVAWQKWMVKGLARAPLFVTRSHAVVAFEPGFNRDNMEKNKGA